MLKSLIWGICAKDTQKKALMLKGPKLKVVLGPSRSLARLGLVLAQAFEQKSLAPLAMPFKKLGLACHILPKSSFQLGLLYDLKKPTYHKKQKMS